MVDIYLSIYLYIYIDSILYNTKMTNLPPNSCYELEQTR
jgi:hypothetical protein